MIYSDLPTPFYKGNYISKSGLLIIVYISLEWNNPPASKASREVANLTWKKNPHRSFRNFFTANKFMLIKLDANLYSLYFFAEILQLVASLDCDRACLNYKSIFSKFIFLCQKNSSAYLIEFSMVLRQALQVKEVINSLSQPCCSSTLTFNGPEKFNLILNLGGEEASFKILNKNQNFS